MTWNMNFLYIMSWEVKVENKKRGLNIKASPKRLNDKEEGIRNIFLGLIDHWMD